MTSAENTNKSILEAEFERLHAERLLVDVHRDYLDKNGTLGRIVQWSQHVLVIEQIDEEAYVYDGISAVRVADITWLRSRTREHKAARQLIDRELSQRLPEVTLLELSAALTTMSNRFGVVAIHTEHVDPNVVFVGTPGELDDDFVVFSAWGTARNADDSRLLMRLDQISRIDADTTYIRRLHTLRRAQEQQSK